MNSRLSTSPDGLFYDGKLVSAFYPRVTGVEQRTFQDGKTSRTYRVRLVGSEEPAHEAEIKDLSQLDIFKLWGVPDALLSARQRQLFLQKMQEDVREITIKNSYEIRPGLQKLNGHYVLLWGDEVFGDQAIDTFLSRGTSFLCPSNFNSNASLGDELDKYIGFWPGVSEPIFYGTLSGITLMFTGFLGIRLWLIILLIGPFGHLKTSMAEIYGLWNVEPDTARSDFKEYTMNKRLLDRVRRAFGGCFLLDDLHRNDAPHASDKQKERLDVLVREIASNTQQPVLIVTGESIDDIGATSSFDRTLEITIPKLSGRELEEKKEKLSYLNRHFMAGVARMFVSKLCENIEQVLEDIRLFLDSFDLSALGQVDFSLRIGSHDRTVLLTEYLFRKYCCEGNESLTMLPQLRSSLNSNRSLQESQIQCMRQAESRDYTLDLYELLCGEDQKEYMDYILDPGLFDYESPRHCLYEKGLLYFSNQAFRSILSAFLRYPVRPDIVAERLKKDGVLVYYGRKNQKQRSDKRWYYAIEKNALELYALRKGRKASATD